VKEKFGDSEQRRTDNEEKTATGGTEIEKSERAHERVQWIIIGMRR
jgi:hypothetical protein